ncbi:MAG: TolC family protein [Myxococcaceae bacterium]
MCQLVLLFYFVCGSVLASIELDIQEAVQIALKKSPDLGQIQLLKEELYWKKWKPISGFLPHLYLGGQYVFAKAGDNLFQGPTSLQPLLASISLPSSYLAGIVSLNLFRGFADVHAYGAFNLAEKAVLLEKTYAQIKIENGVKAAFYATLGTQVILDYFSEISALLNKLSVATEKSIHQGVKTTQALWPLYDKIRELESEKKNVQLENRRAHGELLLLMGLSKDDRKLVGFLPDLSLEQTSFSGDIHQRADLRAKQLMVQIKNKERDASIGAMVPEINFQTSYFYYQNPLNISETASMLNHFSVGVNFIWTVFDAGESIAKYKLASLQVNRTKNNLQQEILKAENDFETQTALLESLRQDEKDNDAEIKSREKILLDIKMENKYGTSSEFDLLEAEIQIIHAKILKTKTAITLTQEDLHMKTILGGEAHFENDES